MSAPKLGTTYIPIKIHSQGDLPLYLQIKYQLSYLITAERIAGGARLPPVRTLAAELNINPHTVAQAYRELQSDGLIESAPGRGSFVRKFSDGKRGETERHGLLTEVLRRARQQGRSMGFSDGEILQRLSSLTVQETVPCHVVFVDWAHHIAEKYARRLEHHLGTGIRATPLTLDDIERRTPEARKVLLDIYYIIAFARNVPSLEKSLTGLGPAYRFLTIVSEVVPETAAALAGLAPETRAVLLTEERYIHSSLNLLAANSQLDPGRVSVFTTDDWEKFLAAAKTADLILYTFGVAEAIAGLDLGVPSLELMFDIGPDSTEKLRRMFSFLDSQGST